MHWGRIKGEREREKTEGGREIQRERSKERGRHACREVERDRDATTRHSEQRDRTERAEGQNAREDMIGTGTGIAHGDVEGGRANGQPRTLERELVQPVFHPAPASAPPYEEE